MLAFSFYMSMRWLMDIIRTISFYRYSIFLCYSCSCSSFRCISYIFN